LREWQRCCCTHSDKRDNNRDQHCNKQLDPHDIPLFLVPSLCFTSSPEAGVGEEPRNLGGSRPGPGAYRQCPTLPPNVKASRERSFGYLNRIREEAGCGWEWS
jgi:hypothetical protein